MKPILSSIYIEESKNLTFHQTQIKTIWVYAHGTNFKVNRVANITELKMPEIKGIFTLEFIKAT